MSFQITPLMVNSIHYPTQQPLRNLLNGNLRTAMHVALIGVPVGIIVGSAVAGYDYVVNALLWDHFSSTFSPEILCLFPLIGMLLTGFILRTFRVKSSSMADEIVKAYHDPASGLDYAKVMPKLAASTATMGFGCSAGMEGACKW